MAERTFSVATYVAVCAALILLTILTVSVSFLQLPRVWHLVIGLVIASVKGSLVVLFFMHALVAHRLTWAVIAVSMFWVLLLFSLTYSDYFTRTFVPYAPGH
jgi:cytochrome c oxidase subunit 4